MAERPDEFEMKPRQVVQKRYATKREAKRPETMNSMDLAWYFAKTIPGRSHNVQALAGSFAKWRKTGLPSEKIHAMIDAFDELWMSGQVNDAAPAWRQFLWKRAQLESTVDHQAKKRERDDPVYQVGRRN